MGNLPVITISRQYGSGGREIGQALAKRLGIPYYDNELIALAAQESGFDPSLFQNADKNASNSLLFSLSMYGASTGTYNMPLGDRVFLIQADIIRKVAEQGPCVIVGRCADYVLQEHENCLSVFIHAPIEKRVAHAVESYGIPSAGAKEQILKTDKKRSVYYAHFTGKRWGDFANYHMTINSDAASIEGTAEVLYTLVMQKAAQK